MMSTIVVALILKIKATQKYLIVRRNAAQSGAGYWEFPGGKVEAAETPIQALQREISEELGLKIDSSELQFVFRNEHEYISKKIDISFYRYEVVHEIPLILVDHDDFKWCDINHLLDHQMAAADIPVIKYLQSKERSV